MLCVWWDLKVVIYFELLDINQTATAEVDSRQLQRFHEAPLQKRPVFANPNNVILLHDNQWPHVTKFIQNKNRQLEWEVLEHALYSSDFASSNYHLFRSFQNYLRDK